MKAITRLSQREVAGIYMFTISLLPPWSKANRVVVAVVAAMAVRERLDIKFPIETSAITDNVDCAMKSLWESAKLQRTTEEEFITQYKDTLPLIMDVDAAQRVFNEKQSWESASRRGCSYGRRSVLATLGEKGGTRH